MAFSLESQNGWCETKMKAVGGNKVSTRQVPFELMRLVGIFKKNRFILRQTLIRCDSALKLYKVIFKIQ